MTQIWTPQAGTLVRRSHTTTTQFTLGTTKPNASNTGLNVMGVAMSDLTVINGDLNITDATISSHGSNTWDRVWVKGSVFMDATQPAFVTNSYIQGPSDFTPSIVNPDDHTKNINYMPKYMNGADRDGIVHARSTSRPTTAVINLDNCVLTCAQPDVLLSSANGERLGYVHRCDISLGSDGLDYWAPSAPDVEGCYFHDHTVWNNDAKHPTDGTHPFWSHNDFIQNSGSNGGHIKGNYFDIHFNTQYGNYAAFQAGDGGGSDGGAFPNGNYGSGIIMTSGSGHITNIQISYNWFNGGECQAFFPYQSGPYPTGNSWEVFNNRFAPNSHGYGPYSGKYSMQACRAGDTTGVTFGSFHDNVWDPDSASAQAVGVAGQSLTWTDYPNATTPQYLASYNSVTQINQLT